MEKACFLSLLVAADHSYFFAGHAYSSLLPVSFSPFPIFYSFICIDTGNGNWMEYWARTYLSNAKGFFDCFDGLYSSSANPPRSVPKKTSFEAIPTRGLTPAGVTSGLVRPANTASRVFQEGRSRVRRTASAGDTKVGM